MALFISFLLLHSWTTTSSLQTSKSIVPIPSILTLLLEVQVQISFTPSYGTLIDLLLVKSVLFSVLLWDFLLRTTTKFLSFLPSLPPHLIRSFSYNPQRQSLHFLSSLAYPERPVSFMKRNELTLTSVTSETSLLPVLV